MVDQNTVDRLDGLLRSAARVHHAEFGGPNPGWPEWYAAYIQPEIEPIADWLPTGR